MPMNWTAEANAKLLLGVLDQLKEMNVKLNYQKLATYMGPDCNRKAIDNQLVKLRKVAAGDNNGQSAPSTPATPAGTPKKRRVPADAKSTPSKKKKVVQDDDDDLSDEERLIKEVRDDIKNL